MVAVATVGKTLSLKPLFKILGAIVVWNWAAPRSVFSYSFWINGLVIHLFAKTAFKNPGISGPKYSTNSNVGVVNELLNGLVLILVMVDVKISIAVSFPGAEEWPPLALTSKSIVK
ncbi:hypothetical protein D3C78_1333250 [compost metagenome]